MLRAAGYPNGANPLHHTNPSAQQRPAACQTCMARLPAGQGKPRQARLARGCRSRAHVRGAPFPPCFKSQAERAPRAKNTPDRRHSCGARSPIHAVITPCRLCGVVPTRFRARHGMRGGRRGNRVARASRSKELVAWEWGGGVWRQHPRSAPNLWHRLPTSGGDRPGAPQPHRRRFIPRHTVPRGVCRSASVPKSKR